MEKQYSKIRFTEQLKSIVEKLVDHYGFDTLGEL
jgi:uncharacterized protein (DUF2132 family)